MLPLHLPKRAWPCRALVPVPCETLIQAHKIRPGAPSFRGGHGLALTPHGQCAGSGRACYAHPPSLPQALQVTVLASPLLTPALGCTHVPFFWKVLERFLFLSGLLTLAGVLAEPLGMPQLTFQKAQTRRVSAHCHHPMPLDSRSPLAALLEVLILTEVSCFRSCTHVTSKHYRT